MLKAYQKYLKDERVLVDENRKEVNQHNRKMLIALLSITSITYIGLLFLASVNEAYRQLYGLYVVSFLYSLIFLFFILKFKEMPVRVICYGTYATMVLFCAYSSAFLAPDAISARVLIFILMFPILFYDYSKYINAAVFVFAGVYLSTIFPFKEGQLQIDEFVNVVCYAMIGVVLGHVVRYTSLRYFALTHVEKRRYEINFSTGLPRYRRMAEKVESRQTPPLALAVISIEGMDTLYRKIGVEYADAYMKEIGNQFQEPHGIPNLSFYYYEGAELIAVAEDHLHTDLLQCLSEIYPILRNIRPEGPDGKQSPLHFEIGAAYWTGDLLKTMKHAGKALDHAKKVGKNRIVIYEDMKVTDEF